MTAGDDAAARIEASLQIAAERAGDVTPLVYARLFELVPEAPALFVRDGTGSIRGEMLHRAIETVLDLVGESRWAPGMIAAESVNHVGLGVPADRFPLFLVAIVDVLREALGADWTPETEAAWRAVHARVAAIVGAAGG